MGRTHYREIEQLAVCRREPTANRITTTLTWPAALCNTDLDLFGSCVPSSGLLAHVQGGIAYVLERRREKG